MIKKSSAAFTLIELLVVITIIAVLAGIALPVYSTVQERGNQTKALSQAKQIGLALKLFAGDNDGNFPQSVTAGANPGDPSTPNFAVPPANANVALKQLIPTYVPSEKIFYVAKSAWTPNPPDEQVTTEAQRLAAGENHWAYVPMLSDTANPNFPLVADGFSGTIGVYSTTQTAQGGVWKGKKAIVVRVDQSGAIETLDSARKVMAKIGGAAKEDIFSTASNGGSWIPSPPVNPQ